MACGPAHGRQARTPMGNARQHQEQNQRGLPASSERLGDPHSISEVLQGEQHAEHRTALGLSAHAIKFPSKSQQGRSVRASDRFCKIYSASL
jgi:hypothetical protein